MWSAIATVTSGLTLVAFLIAAVVAALRTWLRHRERQLIAAPPPARAALVQALNNSFLISARPLSTTKLSPEQAYELLLAQLRARSDRFRITSLVIVLLALVAGGVTIGAVHESRSQPVLQKSAHDDRSRAEFPHTGTTRPNSPQPATITAREPLTQAIPPATATTSQDSERSSATSTQSPTAQETTEIITPTDPVVTYNTKSHIYHCPSCSSARACTKSCVDITLSEALSRGGVACKRCDGTCRD